VRGKGEAVAMGGRESEIGSNAKVNVCLSCSVLGLKGSSLICLSSCSSIKFMLKLMHVGSTVNGDIFVEQSWST